MPPVVYALPYIAAAFAITSAVFSIIQIFNPPKPATVTFGYGQSTGPRYGFGPLDNTISNELPIPVLYGQLKVAGNVIWQTDPDTTVSRIVGLCEGLISYISDIRVNDIIINDTNTPGSSATGYLGTQTQDADSRVPANLRPDLALHNLAYIALTLTASENIKGGNPTLTSVVHGLLVETWQNGEWNTTKVYSRNPVACIRDFLLNSRYGLGLQKSNLNDVSFGEAYDYCEVLVKSSEKYSSDAQTVLLLHMDGTNGSTTFTDSSGSPKTVTAQGDAKLDTNDAYFGSASGFFDGTGDYLTVPDSADWDFGTGDFTIEFFVMFNTVAINMGVFDIGIYSSGIGVQMNVSLTSQLEVRINAAQIFLTTITTIENNRWYHYEISRSGTTLKHFLNGVVIDTATNSSDITGGTGAEIGSTTTIPGISELNGRIDEFRVSKGIARHTATFNPPLQDEPRYRLDYVIDGQRPAQDIINDMLATFSGFIVYAGNLIKLRVEKQESITQYFGDGSTTKANATFDPGNIVRDSFSWNMASLDDRPNRIRVQWVDPSQNYVKVYTQVEDRIDQDERNTIITKDISLLGIIRQTQASRMAKLLMATTKYAHFQVQFAARLESVHCEVGDVVAVTHQSAKFTRRLFRIIQMQETESEVILFTCREYNASLYDDHQASAVVTYDQPAGPNLYGALSDVTGLTLAEDNFTQKDGVFATNILASWTAIPSDQLMRLANQKIQISQDGGTTYRDVVIIGPDKTSYRIVLGNVQTGTTFTVRVKMISDRGSESAGTSGDVTIQGKITPPSDVEDFAVTYDFYHIAMSWSSIDDEDLFGYEIRVGDGNSIWETATIVTTENLGTRYDLFNFTVGTKKFFIKSIDNSGNYSENAASDSISVTGMPNSNVVFTFDLFSRITTPSHPLEGTLSSELEHVPTNDYDPTYNRVTLAPKPLLTHADVQAAYTNLSLQQSSFRWGREEYVTTEENYETTSIDIGALTTGTYILDIETFSSSNLGFVSAQIATSEDDITYTAYRTFVSGQFRSRYVKFKFLLQATNTLTKVRLISALLTVDAPDLVQSFLNLSIGAAGTTINLSGFMHVNSIVITTVGTSNLTPRISDQSALPNSFDVVLFDIAGVLQAGSVNIWISGY